MDSLLSKTKWITNRQINMEQARQCRAVLTDPNGFYRLSADNQRVTEAVAFWVARARRAHNLALGREALIENMVVIQGGNVSQGSVYGNQTIQLN